MPTIGHKHHTLIERKKTRKYIQSTLYGKNTYKHNILLTLLNKSHLFIDDAKKLGRIQD